MLVPIHPTGGMKWEMPDDGYGPRPPQDEDLRNAIERLAVFVAKNGPDFEKMTMEKQEGNPKFAFLYGGPYNEYYRYCVEREVQKNEDLRNAIERLAVFVAKNGPDFEKMTMEKQEGNPKFAFLYGGPYNEYYRYCVEREVQKIHGPPHHGNGCVGPPQPESDFMRRMNSQKEQLRQQITDSERNLKAHLDSIPAMKEAQVAQAVVMSESQKMSQILANVNFDVAPLGAMLDQLNGGKCSKDLVSTSRKWIFEHCQTDQLREVVLTYLLSRVKDSHANDNFRLNILYVINDWAYQCQRKRLDSQTQMLSRYVPQMYAFTVELSQDGMMQQKLDKLIGVWEGHKYFNDQCFKQLRNPGQIYNSAKAVQAAEYAKLAADIEVNLQAMYAGYEQQHKNYVQHIMQQMAQIDMQIETEKDRAREGVPDGDDIDGHPFNEEDLIPSAKYFELPAGIMLPVIEIEQFSYTALVPDKLRMPPPVPPSQRLLNALDEFYSAALDPTREPPLAAWGRGGCSEFMERKQRLKNILEEKLKSENKTIDDLVENKPSEEEMKIQQEDINAEIKMKYEEMRRNAASQENEKQKPASPTVTSKRKDRGRTRDDNTRFRMPPAPLSSVNKGAQLMQKMGWSGTGLGASKQGIIEPISGGEIRDRQDQFRGLGSTMDVYEQYRKQRSGNYHDRNQSNQAAREK
ncbi:surp module [Teladorsagia circumcincta]|uniref:Surp module n=1 Tax=Teladorsagia circumcincta TaxID=45464 RepID=A0A2G9V1D4_TELCI|nr:surp module [Teladorsagia circumcincta]